MLTRYITVHQEPARKNEGEIRLEENRLQEQLIGDPEDDKVNIVQSRHRQKKLHYDMEGKMVDR